MHLFRSALIAACVCWAAGAAWALDSFEDGLAGWRAAGGIVASSNEHWKVGKQSLRWDFTPGATLIRAPDAALEAALQARDGGVKLWLYCEKPLGGALRIQVGPWVFPVNLGFTGWRAVWVVLQEDAQRAPAGDGLQITAPDAPGTLFLDAVELGRVPWSRQGDAQTPYTNPQRVGGKYWFTAQDCAGVPPPTATAPVSPADLRAFREIERRYEEWMFGRLDDPRAPVRARMEGGRGCIRWGNKAFDGLGLVRRGDVVCGPGAFCLTDAHAPHLGADVFQNVALPLAYDARLNDSEAARRRFLDLLDYAHDQGWASGSLMGSGYGEPLRIAGYVHSVYILRDTLRKQGRLDRELETLRYQLSLGEIYRAPEHSGASADDLRTLFLFRLLTVLMMEDSPAKVRDMECLVRWANAALATAPGYGDTIKPDGTVFHHATAYASAYGNNAMLMSSLTYWLMRDTRFALSREAGGNIKKALLTLRFMAGQHQFPMGVSGRWPFSDAAMVETAPALAYMADALNDRELGAAFARLWNPEDPRVQRSFASCGAGIYWCNSPGALPWLLDAAGRYQPEPHPQGCRAYPFAAMCFHRRRQWVASVRGWSRYAWNYEDMPGENRFGRYSSYGMLQIFSRGEPVTREESGYREEGWDWLRPPGATVIRVPLEDLRTSKVLARSYTQDPFVGGVSLQGENGLWAMRFADPLYEKSFRFRKSVFCVGETILCLGSGISNTDAGHSTETVLYQAAVKAPAQVHPAAAPSPVRWLLDPAGNGYYFPEPQVVQSHVQHQESIDNGGLRKTEGDFAVAWLDHGPAPSGAGYAYAVRPDTSESVMRRYADAPDFQVLRRDDAAHIVRFPGSGIVAYVLFAPAEALAFGALSGADTPCLMMTRAMGDRMILSVADPDLRLGEPSPRGMYHPGSEGKVRLHLNGTWQVEAAPGNVRASDDHTLDVTTRDGATYEVVLRRR